MFSGIGGFSVGLEATGKFKTIGFCEQDKFCQKVLRKHWKDISIYEDIKTLDAKKIKADVVVGGFPCQSISVAGKQKGKNDDRFLFPEMFRIIKEVKPKWIIAENVQNLISISNGQILQGILNDLESENYEVQTFSISAQSQGAWHKRQRVWIIAANTKCNKHKNTSTKQSRNEQVRRIYFKEKKQATHDLRSKTSRCDAPLGKQKNLSDSKGIRSQGHKLQHNLENGKKLSEQLCKTNIKKQQTWWQTQSELCGVPNGISHELDKDRANRIKALGNSIVPQIIKEIGKAIIEVENI